MLIISFEGALTDTACSEISHFAPFLSSSAGFVRFADLTFRYGKVIVTLSMFLEKFQRRRINPLPFSAFLKFNMGVFRLFV